MSDHRLNILVIAHEFSPIQGSECAEGWNLVTRLAAYHDITVIYARGSQKENQNYEKAVKEFFSRESAITGLRCVSVANPRITRVLASINGLFDNLGAIGLPMLYFAGYKQWQKKAYKEAKKQHAIHHFDLVHQLTQITFREPGLTWKLGIPFIWGPTGGIDNLPRSFFKYLSGKSRLLEVIRSASNFLQFNISHRVISANKIASRIYAYSHEDKIRLQKRARHEVRLMLDAGTYPIKTRKQQEVRSSESMITGIWCGQMVERKACDILLYALVQDELTRNNVRIKIVGKGPLKLSLQALAKKLRLENIEWIENVSHDEIFSMMSQADFFVHTSIREATSNVIPEALSVGLPVICHDVNGMSVAINNECGIKIPLISPEKSIWGFNAAIKELLINKEKLNQLQHGAIKRAKEISWDVMAKTIATDYLEISNSAVSQKA